LTKDVFKKCPEFLFISKVGVVQCFHPKNLSIKQEENFLFHFHIFSKFLNYKTPIFA